MADHQRRKGSGLTMARRGGIAVALGAAAMLAACASEPPPVQVGDPNVPPTNYRADVLAYLRTYINNPVGVRDAYITEPMLRPVPGTTMQRYGACVRYNARNTVGKYEGSKDHYAAFLAGRLDTIVPARGDQCANVDWLPFPELEKLKR
jgi:hypothetical protein